MVGHEHCPPLTVKIDQNRVENHSNTAESNHAVFREIVLIVKSDHACSAVHVLLNFQKSYLIPTVDMQIFIHICMHMYLRLYANLEQRIWGKTICFEIVFFSPAFQH